MYSPADCIPLSALQHYVFCPRQCALIHVEQTWTENAHTAEGRVLHEKAHAGGSESRGTVKISTALPLCSLELGLSGVADVVEFHKNGDMWQPFPVEYKRGRPKSHDADRVQLCAQALCLEEMLRTPVPEGALFYGKTRRREHVTFDDALRTCTRQIINAVRHMLETGNTPPAPRDAGKICACCSLYEQCMPQLSARGRSATGYLQNLLEVE